MTYKKFTQAWTVAIAVVAAGSTQSFGSAPPPLGYAALPPPGPAIVYRSGGQVIVRWSDNSLGESGFRVQFRGSGTAEWISVGAVGSQNGTGMRTLTVSGKLQPLFAGYFQLRVQAWSYNQFGEKISVHSVMTDWNWH